VLKKLEEMSVKELCAGWESRKNIMKGKGYFEKLYIVDELERRDKVAFDKWLDAYEASGWKLGPMDFFREEGIVLHSFDDCERLVRVK